MKFNHLIKTVDVHVSGEPLRFIFDGIPHLQGDTMIEKMKYMKDNYDHLRSAVMQEPRGFRDLFGGIVTEPVNKNASCGVIYMDCSTYYPMCGTGTIGLASILVDTGRVEIKEPVTRVIIDTPGGQVSCDVNVKDHQVESAAYENVPAFLYRKGVEIESSYFGEIRVDIGYGGNFVVFVDSEEIGVKLGLKQRNRLIEPALEILDAVRKSVNIRHPERDINYIDSCMYIDNRPGNLLVIGRGQVSRSASGTGTPARMAREYSYGRLVLNEEFIHTGLINTKLSARLVRKTKVGNYDAVIARVKGKTYITGIHEFVIDEADPLKEGIFI